MKHPALLALATQLACDPAPPTVLVGEHIDLVLQDPALAPCGDLVGHMDRFVALMAERWQVDLTRTRFTFSWYDAVHYLESAQCPPMTTGCARPDIARAHAAPMDHELAHVVSFEVGRPPPFFTEGAAVAFELPLVTTGLTDRPGDAQIADVLVGVLASEHYNLAGAYTRFLIDRHGMPAYLDFYASLGRDDPADVIADVHADMFGEPLADTVAVFDETRRACDFAGFNFKMFECSGDPLAWDGDVLTVRRDLSCDANGVIGPFAVDHVSRLYTNFTVDAPGLFDLSIAADPLTAGVTIAGCGGCGTPGPQSFRSADGPHRIQLAAGHYYLLMTGSLTQDTAAAVRLARVL